MSDVLADLSTARFVGAIEANLQECFGSFRHLPNARVEDSPELFSVRTEVPLSFCNGIARACFPADSVETCIERAVSVFQSRAVPFRWWLTPSTRPADLATRLTAHGLRHVFDAPGMAIDLSILDDAAPWPAGLRIEHVIDRAGMQRWVSAFVAGFDRSADEGQRWLDTYASFGFGPDAVWQHYVGLVDDEPVATSSLFLGGGAAGLYHIVTAEQHRGRGIGAAMTRYPLQQARARGYRIGVLQTSDMGVPVYRSVGFEVRCPLSMFAWEPPREADGA